MKRFIYSLMTDKAKGPIPWALKSILYLSSLIYGLAIYIRKGLYRAGIIKSRKVPLKVISVGNLTLGGTGKTPFVITLSRILKDGLGKEVSVLIRGYGWDEPAMLRNNLPDVPVVVGEDRVKQARRAIKLYASDVAVLDDGFQYWELERDMDIVLVDSRNPFGNGFLFPRGILRERVTALARADIVVFTKVDKRLRDIEELKETIRGISPGILFLEAMHKPAFLYDSGAKTEVDLSSASRRKAILVSSIGDPGYFEETVKSLGANVIEHIAFGDHHNYRERDIRRIMKRCDERSFDLVITTEKDAVKLNRMNFSFGDYTLLVLKVEMEITLGRRELDDRLHSLFNSLAGQ